MTTTDLASLVADFDAQNARKADARNRAARSARQRQDVARTASGLLRLAVGAGALGLLVAVVVAFV